MRKLIFIAALFTLAYSNNGFAGAWNKARDLDVDRQLTEMNTASIILPPGKHENSNMNPKQGTIPGLGLSDTGTTAKGSSAGIGGANTSLENSGAGSLPSENSGTSTGGGLGGNTNLDTGTGGLGGSTGGVTPDVGTDLTEEPPTVGGDVSGGDYLISVDASVGSTEVSADLIPSDSLDDTLIGETTDIGAEIDASGDLSGSEADIGIEADVDGSVSGDDIADDPADGLSSSTTLL